MKGPFNGDIGYCNTVLGIAVNCRIVQSGTYIAPLLTVRYTFRFRHMLVFLALYVLRRRDRHYIKHGPGTDTGRTSGFCFWLAPLAPTYYDHSTSHTKITSHASSGGCSGKIRPCLVPLRQIGNEPSQRSATPFLKTVACLCTAAVFPYRIHATSL